MVEKMWRSFDDGRNMRERWQTLPTTEDLLLDVSLRGLVPVSIHLQKNIRTPKGLQIIKRAERALMNERIRSINNTLNMVRDLRDTCTKSAKRSA